MGTLQLWSFKVLDGDGAALSQAGQAHSEKISSAGSRAHADTADRTRRPPPHTIFYKWLEKETGNQADFLAQKWPSVIEKDVANF